LFFKNFGHALRSLPRDAQILGRPAPGVGIAGHDQNGSRISDFIAHLWFAKRSLVR